MRLLLELSMECESLARSEALSAMRALGDSPEVVEESAGALVVSSSVDADGLASRLALCHHVSEWLGSCGEPELRSLAEGMDLPGPIRVRATKVGQRSVDLADAASAVGGIVGRSAGVDLHHPRTDLRVVFSDRVHVGRLLASIDRPSFERRKNRYLPFVYPASIHPKFARAAVNMTEVRPGQRLLDPFCGTGAILAEAAMVGCETIGSDISDRMILGASRNLSHLGVKADLFQCDVGDVPARIGLVDGIASDLPYGRSTSTRGEGITDLYQRALDSFDSVLSRGARAVVILPTVDAVASESRFEVVETHKLWIHRSLTRHFCVLRKL